MPKFDLTKLNVPIDFTFWNLEICRCRQLHEGPFERISPRHGGLIASALPVDVNGEK